MLYIKTILCRAGTMDNYSYLITDSKSSISAIIDPSEATPIIKRCSELNITPSYILNTHHHFDHTDANLELKELYNAKVVGNINDASRIPGFDIGVIPGEIFKLGESTAEIIDVSAHTQNHILWYFSQDKALFTGDTLFNLCVGGLFEGTAAEMFVALQKIKSLPNDVRFYPGHEYTMSAANFAYQVCPNNSELQKYLQTAQDLLRQGLPAGPFTLGEEKSCNPYLQANSVDQLKRLF